MTNFSQLISLLCFQKDNSPKKYLNLIFAFLFCMALQCCDSKSNNHFTPSPMLSQLVAEFNNYLPLSVGQIGQITKNAIESNNVVHEVELNEFLIEDIDQNVFQEEMKSYAEVLLRTESYSGILSEMADNGYNFIFRFCKKNKHIDIIICNDELKTIKGKGSVSKKESLDMALDNYINNLNKLCPQQEDELSTLVGFENKEDVYMVYEVKDTEDEPFLSFIKTNAKGENKDFFEGFFLDLKTEQVFPLIGLLSLVANTNKGFVILYKGTGSGTSFKVICPAADLKKLYLQYLNELTPLNSTHTRYIRK